MPVAERTSGAGPAVRESTSGNGAGDEGHRGHHDSGAAGRQAGLSSAAATIALAHGIPARARIPRSGIAFLCTPRPNQYHEANLHEGVVVAAETA